MDNDPDITFPSPSALLRRDLDDEAMRPPPAIVPAAIVAPAGPNSQNSWVPKRKPLQMKSKRSDPIGEANVKPNGKPKQSKSRNGCVTCKQKRLKCDETKPSCNQCSQKKILCGGYKKDFKWRPFEEPPGPQKSKKRAENPPAPDYCSSFPALDTPNLSTGSSLTTSPEAVVESPPFAQKKIELTPPKKQQRQPSKVRPAGHKGASHHAGLKKLESSEPDLLPEVAGEPLWEMEQFDDVCDALSLSEPAGDIFGQDRPNSSLCLNDSFPSFLAPRDICAVGDAHKPEAEDAKQRLALSRRPASTAAPRALNLARQLLNQPKLGRGSTEMLISGYNQRTCGILSVRDGPSENPWRNLIIPLIHESVTLRHAVESLTAFHESKLNPDMKRVGAERMNKSISSLRTDLQTMRPDLALASTLVLAFAESWSVHVSTGIQHLAGAKCCIERAGPLVKKCGPNHIFSKRIKFLCNTWVYMDVISRLTSVNADDSTEFETILQIPGLPLGSDMDVDPLMGSASTLFPLIGKVANLVRKVRKSAVNSITIVSQASELKAAIEAWKPPQMQDEPEDEYCDALDAIKTAEAYRWATLLYLHQAVPEVHSPPSAELAYQALLALAQVNQTSRTTIVQIYPLMAAGCEAVSTEDREWVEQRWLSMSRHMLIGNVDKCLEVVKEVWNRRDQYDTYQCLQRRGGWMHRESMTSEPPSLTYDLLDPFSPDDVLGSPKPWDLVDMGRSLPAEADNRAETLRSPVGADHALFSWMAGVAVPLNSPVPNGGWQHGHDQHFDVQSPEPAALQFPLGPNSVSPNWMHFGGMPPNGPILNGGYHDGYNRQEGQSRGPTRAAAAALSQWSMSNMANASFSMPFRNVPGSLPEDPIPERTVRGRQHWIGVMQEWEWEVLLG